MSSARQDRKNTKESRSYTSATSIQTGETDIVENTRGVKQTKRIVPEEEKAQRQQMNMIGIQKIMTSINQSEEKLTAKFAASETLVSWLQRDILLKEERMLLLKCDADKSIQVIKHDLANIHTGILLADALEKVTLLRYPRQKSCTLIARDATNIIMSDNYLNGSW